MTMILLMHITVAIAGLAASTMAFVAPSRTKIVSTVSLIGLTVLSGSVLVVTTHSSILHSCIAGLVYVAIASTGALLGHRKLARQAIQIRNDK